MNDAVLTREKILETAEDVLRRYGPAKATVVDVARALDVSHGSVYRHFPSKAALREAVVERLLERVSRPLEGIVAEDAPADERLYRWCRALMAAKHHKVNSDPELFATYMTLAQEARDVVTAHVEHLIDQVSAIIADGITRGEFREGDPRQMARAVLMATAPFHHPAFAANWSQPDVGADFDAVWAMIRPGLMSQGKISSGKPGAGKPGQEKTGRGKAGAA
ncbi:MAG TPA: TetR family transcriptional regulator [Dongiaceae bacterium]|nr:TetR family transcriptional regulator [Dongiaceae bacterium]